jgi:hypothetical protein
VLIKLVEEVDLMSPSDSRESAVGAEGPPRCSFCKKSPADGGPLIEGPILEWGPRAYICSACVELCSEIFENERTRAASEPQDATGPSREEVLRAGVDQVLASLSEAEREVIKLVNGLSDGSSHTHDEIALKLGIPPASVAEIEAQAIAKLQAQGSRPAP